MVFKSGLQRALSRLSGSTSYKARVEAERRTFSDNINVHDLPEIFHHWSHKYLLPKLADHGYANLEDVFVKAVLKAREKKGAPVRIISLGAGNCDFEIEILTRIHAAGAMDVRLDCLDLVEEMLARGRRLAVEKNLDDHMGFVCSDLNTIEFGDDYDVFFANQSLHHFLELETIFTKVRDALPTHGYFVTSDMIGRNGHMRWPEAKEVIDQLWYFLPDNYKYNHQLKRLEETYDNWDCSKEGFEGIRAQDILPLLTQYFEFEYFLAFSNLIDIFCDRGFGHNFSVENSFDRAFIDFVAELDHRLIQEGTLTPTHLIAIMTSEKPEKQVFVDDLDPQRCIRWPEAEPDTGKA